MAADELETIATGLQDIVEPAWAERLEPRSIPEIFADLRALAHTDGSLHCISAIIQRDWFLTIDMQKATIASGPVERWSVNRLNNNELMLLLGLAVQSPSDRTFKILPQNRDFIEHADRLLREFHDATMEPLRLSQGQDPSKIRLNDIAREAIYYGADSFFMSQFEKFARHRYRQDADWLLKNAKISIVPMLKIARFIADRTNLQMTYVFNTQAVGARLDHTLDFGTLTGMLAIPKSELTKKFGEKVNAFLAKFATPAVGQNAAFDNPFAVNQVNAAPLIDLGEFIFVPNQYRLFASIYESPFYWTMADAKYKNIASENRGHFVEKSASVIFREIFGDEYVHDNVVVMDGKDIAAEADVLVSYGEFLIVVQAKSKRITLKARAGDDEALRADFKGAVQDPYDQAYKFGRLIESGAQCIGTNGKAIKLPNVKRMFPVVLLSDSFPSATFLSRSILKRDTGGAPVIWDMAILDTVARVLPTPVDFLYFLKCRSDVFDVMLSDSEYNYLGYHLKFKLVKAPGYDFIDIGRDFATPVDDYMVALEAGASPQRPVGILDRIEIPFISEMFKELKAAPPDLAGILIDLYDYSSDSLRALGGSISGVRAEVEMGKPLKSLSVTTASGGLTYVIARNDDPHTRAAARAIGHKYKYDNKRDRWYVIVNSLKTDRTADAVLSILGKWVEDPEMEEKSKLVGKAFASKFTPLVAGD